MNSADAAEQIVRMSLEGIEVAAKITGAGAKEIAALLYAILKDRNPKMAKGKKNLANMLKRDKEIKVFTTSVDNAKAFHHASKEYGFPYYPIPNKKKFQDGQMDFLCYVEDTNKIRRVEERFKLTTVDTATIKTEVEKTKNGKEIPFSEITGEQKVMTLFSMHEEKLQSLTKEFKKNGVDYRPLNSTKDNKDGIADILVQAKDKEKVCGIMEKLNIENLAPQAKNGEKSTPEKDIPQKSDDDKLVDELIGKPQQKEVTTPQNPQVARTEKSPPSEPISSKQSKTAEGATKSSKPSVREELKAIKAEQEQKADMPKRSTDKSIAVEGIQHKQPQSRKKDKKSKAR